MPAGSWKATDNKESILLERKDDIIHSDIPMAVLGSMTQMLRRLTS